MVPRWNGFPWVSYVFFFFLNNILFVFEILLFFPRFCFYSFSMGLQLGFSLLFQSPAVFRKEQKTEQPQFA